MRDFLEVFWSQKLDSTALIASLVAVYYAIRAFRLKDGVEIRGYFGATESVDCPESYVNSATLENLKERAVVVFAIYIEFAYGIYLSVEEFESNPLILRPFEVWHRDYASVDFYSESLSRVTIPHLFTSPARPKLVLSTSEGRFVVRDHIPRWHVEGDLFKNRLTRLVRPERFEVGGRTHGRDARYLVQLELLDGGTRSVAIEPNDCQKRRFEGFVLTRESLASHMRLQAFLTVQMKQGRLSASSVKVIDLWLERQRLHNQYAGPAVPLTPSPKWKYHIVGRALALLDRRRIRRVNRRLVEAIAVTGTDCPAGDSGGPA